MSSPLPLPPLRLRVHPDGLAAPGAVRPETAATTGPISLCSRIRVTLLGDGSQEPGLPDSQGLREVLLTHWSGGVIEYEGPPPKIT